MLPGEVNAMAEEEDDQQESNRFLRDKLSTTSNLATDALARAVIAEESLAYVKVEDFKGSDPTKVEEQARSLNAEREVAANEALSQLLKSKGVEDIDALINQGGGGGGDREAIEAARRQTGSPSVSASKDLSHIDPLDGSAQMVEHFKRSTKAK